MRALLFLLLLLTSCAQPQLIARGPPPSTNWWCDKPQGYYPSVPSCSTPWRAINATSAVAAQPTTEPPPASSAGPAAPITQVRTPQPLVVAIETSVSGGARPTVTGTTNLPDGMLLTITLKKPWLPNGAERVAAGLPACGDDCAPLNAKGRGFDDLIVTNGRFNYGPFTDMGAALIAGAYVLEITSPAPRLQPPEVRAVIGERGENMTGPLVGRCCFADPLGPADAQKQMETQRRLDALLGASIYYARYVTIGPD